jgi:alanine racemase
MLPVRAVRVIAQLCQGEARGRGVWEDRRVLRTEAVIDLAAITGNVATMKADTPAELMAVVKADGYGHGLLPSARAALAGGATWLGTAIVDEAIALRAAGITLPLLSWLWTPGESDTVRRALDADVDISVSDRWQLASVIDAVRVSGRTARIHLKIDTGLSRNGSYVDDWPDLVAAAAKAQAAEEVEIVGVWSHFAYADEPGHPTISRQIDAFRAALDTAARGGVEPQLRHLANSAATLTLPDAHFDLVRPGIAVYGLSPVPEQYGLVPAMTVRGAAALVKRVRAGEGVSYGHEYTTTRDTTLVLVPLGYADGVPRHASKVGPVWVNGARFTIAGRVCMDQIVIDVGDLPVEAGDPVVLFGSGREGEPTAQDWADVVGTIHYEIVTRIGPRVQRTYVGAPA